MLVTLLDARAEKYTILVDSIPYYQLVNLPYEYNSLEPAIGAQTMQLHHGKHLQGYVDKLTRLVAHTPYAQMPISRIVMLSDSSIYDEDVFNNAGQVLNHNLYFLQFSPQGGGEPSGLLLDAIINRWGSFEEFKYDFDRSGAGWVWLACDHEGQLYIIQEPNGGNPVTHGLIPLLGIDVWEHAYYLDYQNRRKEHLTAVWNIIDWPVIERRYESTGVAENSCQTAVEKLWD